MAINDPLLAQRRQEELARDLAWLDAILSGQQPEGFVPTLQSWGQVLDLLGDVAAQRGVQAIQPAMARWVEPALSGVLGRDLQFQAMNLLASFAPSTGQLDPRVLSFLQTTPQTIQGFGARADILTQLAPTFGHQEWFRRLVNQFLQTAAPGGSVAGMPVPIWGAAAAPLFAMQSLLGGPEGAAAAGLPQIAFPQAGNMPRQAQNVLRAIQDAELAARGLQLGPEGVVEMTPLERQMATMRAIRPLLQQGWANIDPLAGFAASLGVPHTATSSPAAAAAQTATADGTPLQQVPRAGTFIQLLRNALQNMRQLAQGFEDIAQTANRLIADYRAAGLSPAQLERDLEKFRDELVAEMGTDAFNRLLNYVRGISRG